MMIRRTFFRVASLAVASVVFPVALVRPARAFPVIDAAGIAQIAVQAAEVWAQVQTLHQQVEALRAAALQLDPRSYQSVQNLLSGNDVNYLSLLRDVRSMGFTVERVNTRFRQLFPDDQAVKKMTPRQAEATSKEMNEELYSSALVAARAQTTLRTIEDNNVEARNILSQSQGNGSQVAQLQSALQMLALMHQNLVTITQLVSSSGRVASNQAVRAVTERRIASERATRMMRDYDKPTAIPDIDQRFLQGDTW